jgi:hypothetical protein
MVHHMKLVHAAFLCLLFAAAALAQTFSGLSPATNTVLANYSIADTDCGKIVQAGSGSSGFFTITVPSAGSVRPGCGVTITNGDTVTLRGKGIANDPGCSTRNTLWPGQSCSIATTPTGWAVQSRPGRWRPPAGAHLNFFADMANGNDAAGVTDGLALGAAAFQTVENCFLNVGDQIDYGAVPQATIDCNMAPATIDTHGMHAPVHAMVGAQGGAALRIVGASLAITGTINNGGLCELQIPGGTGTYTVNEVVSVYGMTGPSTCNGTWKVGTINDGTHLTLTGTAITSAGSTNGTITNGSSFGGASGIVQMYYDVYQFINVNFNGSTGGLQADFAAKIYLLAGNTFGGSPSGDMINAFNMAVIHLVGDVGIATGASGSFVKNTNNGSFRTDGGWNVNFLPGVNPLFAGLGWAYADRQSEIDMAGDTIVLNSNAVTGIRCAASLLGLVSGGTGAPNTFFPGSIACTAATGGGIEN